jgi:pyridoxal phosphate enzyme (YggS family)
MTMISDNLQRVQARIEAACAAAGRDPASVALLAVSKTFGAEAVKQAFKAGQRAFGENYVQEGVEKIQQLRQWGHESAIQWHMIGPIQSNKTRWVAEHFDWVHSVDRLKTAERLSEQRPAHLPPLQICLQVNIDGGPNKSGVSPDELAPLALQVAALPRLQLRGLMGIPEIAPDFIASCAVFSRLGALFYSMKLAHHGVDTLSMGMSADLEAAVQSGSTMVRVGTAIFGSRTAA